MSDQRSEGKPLAEWQAILAQDECPHRNCTYIKHPTILCYDCRMTLTKDCQCGREDCCFRTAHEVAN